MYLYIHLFLPYYFIFKETKIHLAQAMVFQVVMYGCESWTIEKAECWRIAAFWTVLLEKTIESPLDWKKIQPVHPERNESWIFIRRTDVETKTPILWPRDAKNWLSGKEPDPGNNWGWEEKRTTEDEMVGWHHWLSGCEFEWTPGVGGIQGGLVCCSAWGRKESDTTEQLNWSGSSTYMAALHTAINPLGENCYPHFKDVETESWESENQSCLWERCWVWLPWWLRQWRICPECRRHGFNPWVGKIPWRKAWQPTPVFLPGEFHGQRSLAGYSPWGCKEMDTTEQLKLYRSKISTDSLKVVMNGIILLCNKKDMVLTASKCLYA